MTVLTPVLHLKFLGLLLIGLALFHIFLPRRFGWIEELRKVELLTRQIFYVHMFFIALMVGLMGILALFYAEELVRPSTLGKAISGGLTLFWGIRVVCQLFVYDKALWLGKRFETSMHALFTLLWLYLTVVFGWVFCLQCTG